MIQDIAPHHFDNAFVHRRLPEAGDFVLYYDDNKVLIRKQEDYFSFPTVQEAEEKNPDLKERLTYLFSIDETAYYLILDLDPETVEGCSMESQTMFRELQPQWQSFAGITGSQLYRWTLDHKYCGRCGKEMKPSGKERAFCCDNCGSTVYPKISPAVIVGVTHGNRLLLSRYAGRTYKRYALIAGFTEFGETLEETVHREVMEEVGVKVKNIRYFGCQPWSFSDSLLMGFFADLDGEEDITLDEEELAEAEWFDRENIPPTSSLISLTSPMIEAFRAGEW